MIQVEKATYRRRSSARRRAKHHLDRGRWVRMRPEADGRWSVLAVELERGDLVDVRKGDRVRLLRPADHVPAGAHGRIVCGPDCRWHGRHREARVQWDDGRGLGTTRVAFEDLAVLRIRT